MNYNSHALKTLLKTLLSIMAENSATKGDQWADASIKLAQHELVTGSGDVNDVRDEVATEMASLPIIQGVPTPEVPPAVTHLKKEYESPTDAAKRIFDVLIARKVPVQTAGVTPPAGTDMDYYTDEAKIYETDALIRKYTDVIVNTYRSRTVGGAANPYYYDEYVLKGLVGLAVCEARLILGIKQMKNDDPDMRAKYLEIVTRANDNLKKILHFLVELNTSGVFAGKLKGKEQNEIKEIDQVTVWIANLNEVRFDFLEGN